MKKLLLILALTLTLTSCYMPPRFMETNPYYDDDYYVGSNAKYASAKKNADIIPEIAKDLTKQIEMVIQDQKSYAGEKLTLTVAFYAINHNIDDKLHDALVDRISYELYKRNNGKYEMIFPDLTKDKALKKEGLQTNETPEDKLEKDLMKEYDPGVKITIETGKLSSGVIEISASVGLETTGKEIFGKTYKVYPDNNRNSGSNSDNSSRITTTYYAYSVPVFTPPYYYWGYPRYYYWGWSYPHYRYSYWRHRPHYRTYRSYPSKPQRPSTGYYHK